jgi:hypothetical protein
MLTMVLAAATEQAEQHRELPFPAAWFGIGAIVVFAGLLAFTWAFRSVAHKH